MALLFIDLDDFKRINDGAGHTSGDACLRQVADTLRGLLCAFDRAGWIGGDEFAVLLTPVDEVGAERVAQRILRAFQALRLSLPGEVAGVSASLGLCLAGPDDDVEDLLHKADQARYRAKGGPARTASPRDRPRPLTSARVSAPHRASDNAAIGPRPRLPTACLP